MKEFDLEAAKKGAELCLRNGKKLVERHIGETFITGSFYIRNGGLAERVWDLNGKLFCVERSDEDLMIDDEFPEGNLRKFISKVDHPAHYNNGSIECIDAMRAAFGDEQVEIFCRLSAFKYLWRAERKENKKQDLDKAKWYIDYGLKLLKKDSQREG